MDTTTDPATPVLRADAAENRRRILEAAPAVFAERGLDAPLDEIARRAGVGNATLYRRFPTRDDLVAAVFEQRLAEYIAAAEEALRVADPWAGFCQYVERICEMQAADQGAAEVLAMTFPNPAVQTQNERAYDAFTRLVHRARDAGRLRPDFTVEDFVLLMLANIGVVRGTGELAEKAVRRHAALVLAGLQAESDDALPPPLSAAEIESAMRGRISDRRAKAKRRPAASEGARAPSRAAGRQATVRGGHP